MTSQLVASYQAAALLVYSGVEAERAIASAQFRSEWKVLADKCPWSTVFQTPEYACTWYQCYAELYQPLVLVRYATSGEMDGLMALAVERASGKLTFPGAHQAEYHVWLALPGEQTFIDEALVRLRELGFASLSFSYLPPQTPLQWLNKGWARRSIIRALPRPLLMLDGDHGDPLGDWLSRKQENRWRMRKLQKTAPLSFLELHTAEELDRYYDQMIDFYDFRVAARFGGCPFRDDPRKRSFYRLLMAQGGLLVVTILKVGDQLISARIDLRNKGDLLMTLPVHSPFHALYSPGKLHVLHLGSLLSKQGFSSLDLTPGGDTYKDDWATRYDEVHQLTVFCDSKGLALHRMAVGVRLAAKAIVGVLGVDKKKAGRGFSAASRAAANPVQSLLSLVKGVRRQIWSSREVRLYRAPVHQVEIGSGEAAGECDRVQDLLAYAGPESTGQSRQEFLQQAMARFESGAPSHSYSLVQDGVLLHCAWLTSRIGKPPAELRGIYEFPVNSALIWDFYTHASHQGGQFVPALLRRMLSDASATTGVDFIYVAVRAEDSPVRRAVEAAGLPYQRRILWLRRLGIARCRVAENPQHEGIAHNQAGAAG